MYYQSYAQISKSTYKLIKNNITSYHTRNVLNHVLGLDNNGFLDFEETFTFDKFILHDSLIFKIKPLFDSAYFYSGYKLYSVEKQGFRFINEKGLLVSYNRSHPYSSCNELYMFGIDSITKRVNFISGEFFKHRISQDFNLNIKKPQSFIKYLKFKLFNYQISTVKYLKKEKNKLVFQAFSNCRNSTVKIFVDLEDFDLIKVL